MSESYENLLVSQRQSNFTAVRELAAKHSAEAEAVGIRTPTPDRANASADESTVHNAAAAAPSQLQSQV